MMLHSGVTTVNTNNNRQLSGHLDNGRDKKQETTAAIDTDEGNETVSARRFVIVRLHARQYRIPPDKPARRWS